MSKEILIFGGAGFIGCNLADYYLKKGDKVTIFDNFSRQGTVENAKWLGERHEGRLKIVRGDIRTDQEKLSKEIDQAEIIFHMAAQVAVTTSVTNPREDFLTNVLGTFNILEAIRKSNEKPVLIYASTNKVYGGAKNIEIVEKDGRYEYQNLPYGISENQLLDFYSPYGCSKGAAEQYVRDYARIYGLSTVVFRQSCIYGERQFGLEDQGWVAWFTIASSFNKPITIYGDGKQVRDVLYIQDFLEVCDLAIENIEKIKGNIYNIGGGIHHTLSLLELIDYLEKLFNKKVVYSFGPWRPGDQRVYISDIRKVQKDLNWAPQTSVENGLKKLASWVEDNQGLFKEIT